jgi:hypothetical protein
MKSESAFRTLEIISRGFPRLGTASVVVHQAEVFGRAKPSEVVILRGGTKATQVSKPVHENF